MEVINVGVGEIAISDKPDTIVKTYALGACIGLIFHAPKHKMVGLAHIALPDSNYANGNKNMQPGYYADLAIPKIIQKFKERGIHNNSDVIIKMTGGAQIKDPNARFNIGKRNVLATRKVLWKYKLGAISEDVGEDISRTVSVSVNDGEIIISSPGKGEWKI